MKPNESFSNITDERMKELTKFRIFEKNLCVENILVMDKLKISTKKSICTQIIKNIKTGDFYDKESKENCVDDLGK